MDRSVLKSPTFCAFSCENRFSADVSTHSTTPSFPSRLYYLPPFCSSNLVGTVPGQVTSIARRGPLGRTHSAGTRRTSSGTSQGVPQGPTTPLGEVNGTGTRLPIGM